MQNRQRATKVVLKKSMRLAAILLPAALVVLVAPTRSTLADDRPSATYDRAVEEANMRRAAEKERDELRKQKEELQRQKDALQKQLEEARKPKPAPAPKPQSKSPVAVTPQPKKTSPAKYRNSVGIEFVLIPAGTFMMGCSSGADVCYDDEMPRHQVTISHPFYLGKYEVTQRQW